MVSALSRALLLGTLLLGANVAAQSVPVLPPAAPVTPVPPTEPAPVPVEPAPVDPVPVEPAPVEPPPAEPVPVDPAPRPPAKPVAPAQPTPQTSAPLLINVEAQWPAVVNGKKTVVPFTRTLTIPGHRVSVLRQRGVITPSLEADVAAFIKELPTEPHDARFEELWDGWALVQRNGLKVDGTKTRQSILTALKNPKGVKATVVISGQVAPKRTLDYFVSRGITAHLGSGETNYHGSSPARMTNIHVGAASFKDRLFEGKTFSFNQMIGPISTQSGYVTGLVIAGERTASGVGGGICQVSTTIFRTLYKAGLPVVERRNHSYQVHYNDPQGMDATIYQPSQDLRFANDTGGALWFQTDWDDKEARLSVHVFGKVRDHTVEVGAPRTLSTTPSPKDRLIQDATLNAGQRKQVDWAAPGAVIEVTRKFIRDGKVFKQDTLRSQYRPWPNIFLVGTKS